MLDNSMLTASTTLHLACAGVCDSTNDDVYGSAFLIAPTLAFTAKHVVDRVAGGRMSAHFRLRFMRQNPDRVWGYRFVNAILIAAYHDCALIELGDAVTDVPGLRLASNSASPPLRSSWTSYGCPHQVDVPVRVQGIVLGDASIPGCTNGIQLECTAVAAGLNAPGLSGSPVLIDDQVVGMIVYDLAPIDVTVGGILFAMVAHDLVQTILAARLQVLFQFNLNDRNGAVLLDAYRIHICPGADEEPASVPLAALQKVWIVGIDLLETIVRFESIGDSLSTAKCSTNGLSALGLLIRALPQYVNVPESIRQTSPESMRRPLRCLQHGSVHGTRADCDDVATSVVEIVFAREELYHTIDGEVIPDLFAVSVTAPSACVEALRLAIKSAERSIWLAHVASWSLIVAMGVFCWMLYHGVSVSSGVTLAASVLLSGICMYARMKRERRIKQLVMHLVDDEVVKRRQPQAVLSVSCKDSEAFSCSIRLPEFAPKYPLLGHRRALHRGGEHRRQK